MPDNPLVAPAEPIPIAPIPIEHAPLPPLDYEEIILFAPRANTNNQVMFSRIDYSYKRGVYAKMKQAMEVLTNQYHYQSLFLNRTPEQEIKDSISFAKTYWRSPQNRVHKLSIIVSNSGYFLIDRISKEKEMPFKDIQHLIESNRFGINSDISREDTENQLFSWAY